MGHNANADWVAALMLLKGPDDTGVSITCGVKLPCPIMPFSWLCSLLQSCGMPRRCLISWMFQSRGTSDQTRCTICMRYAASEQLDDGLQRACNMACADAAQLVMHLIIGMLETHHIMQTMNKRPGPQHGALCQGVHWPGRTDVILLAVSVAVYRIPSWYDLVHSAVHRAGHGVPSDP